MNHFTGSNITVMIMRTKTTYTVVAVLAFIFISCQNQNEKSKKTEEVESTEQAEEISESEDTSSFTENERSDMVADINQFIATRTDDDDDTTIWKFTLYDEQGMDWDIEIPEDENSDYCSVSLYLKRAPVHVVTFHFDTNGLLCRMDELEVQSGYWRDERKNTYYFSQGRSYWIQYTHIYKDKTVTDTTYSFPGFTEDTFPIFWDKDWVDKNVATLEPTNL